jgi:hypothetical protein
MCRTVNHFFDRAIKRGGRADQQARARGHGFPFRPVIARGPFDPAETGKPFGYGLMRRAQEL